jgi:hypothetical protein
MDCPGQRTPFWKRCGPSYRPKLVQAAFIQRFRLSDTELASSAADQKTLFPLVTSRLRILGFRFFTNFSAMPRVRRPILVRDSVVLTTSPGLILRRPFLHSSIFTFRIVVLHIVDSLI